MKKELGEILLNFPSISLEQLNSTSSLMDRVEQKFILSLEQLNHFLSIAHQDYYVLQIKNKTIFSYHNIYMDTQDYFFYHQHAQEKTQRTKIRTRRYMDSDLSFFEYKQKEGKMIRKLRYQCDIKEHGKMTDKSHKFYTESLEKFESEHTRQLLSPSISTQYQRITLCNKNTSERVTIDFNVKLKDLRDKSGANKTLEHFAILESKSESEISPSYHTMKAINAKKASRCSKYCLGVYYFDRSTHKDTFENTVSYISSLEQIKQNSSKTKKISSTNNQENDQIIESSIITTNPTPAIII